MSRFTSSYGKKNKRENKKEKKRVEEISQHERERERERKRERKEGLGYSCNSFKVTPHSHYSFFEI